jgi:hypothetical protein
VTDQHDALIDFGNIVSEIHEQSIALTNLAHGFEARRVSTKATRMQARLQLRRLQELSKQAHACLVSIGE